MLGIGGALGLPLAGLIGEHGDYHLLFWICVAGGAVSLLGAWFFLTEPPRRAPGRFDLPGAILLAAALVCLLLPLSEAGVWGWGAPRSDRAAGGRGRVAGRLRPDRAAGCGHRWWTWRSTPARPCC